MSEPEPETVVKEDWLSVLKGFDREEIEEVFSEGFCSQCQLVLHTRIQSIANRKHMNNMSVSAATLSDSEDTRERFSESSTNTVPESSTSWVSKKTRENAYTGTRNGYVDKSSPASVNSRRPTPLTHSKPSMSSSDNGIRGSTSAADEGLSAEQKEKARFANVGRKKDFVHLERVDGKRVNVLQGLELHTRVFDAEEQKKIVESVYEFQRMGQKGLLRERTYTEPSKWMRGKGRVTIQFGCCYNYAVDKNGNPPGIIREEEVDPLPPVLRQMIKRMVRWHVLPPTCVPNSCIVNIYDEGDCIPPHIDHHDFLRPFCTVSFLTECHILFGANLKIVGPGEFAGPVSIPLPTGSVLILNGNGADVAKHCVPAVPAKRISITFRRMDESKIPYGFAPDPDLAGLRPLAHTGSVKPLSRQNQAETKAAPPPRTTSKTGGPSFSVEENDFPPLGASTANRRRG